jgi:phosphoribosylaminoimidazole carboxylase (NCAIR synthetase)
MRGSAGGGGLSSLSGAALTDEIYARRASYQRSLSRAKEMGEEVMFEASVHNFLDDVQAIRGVPLEVTMHAAVVTDDSGGYDIRGIYATRALARARLEMEVASKTHVPIAWEDFGEFSTSSKIAATGCTYHTDPVAVKA